MDPRAVEKANSRVRVAKKAIEDLRTSKTYTEFSDYWYVFLTSAKNVYTVLEQGSKSTPQSRQWFGGKASVRRNDELLQYLYEARNDDEHGLGSSIDQRPEMFEIGVRAPGYSNAVQLDGGGFDNVQVIGFDTTILTLGAPPADLRVRPLDGKPVLVRRTPGSAVLVPVTARGNRVLMPPTTHLGKKLESTTPLDVAAVAVSYLEGLLEEAANRAEVIAR